MRLTKVDIESYGHFDGRSFEMDPARIVVVYGPNEAGKTTFASFLVSMMFGFSPGNIDQHPYARTRSVDRRLAGRLEFVSEDRRRCGIFRELKSTPKSRYTSGEGLFGDEEDLRNRPLPVVDHVNRRVFQSVYSLSLAQMEQIESRTWDFVQDRLLGGLSMDYLKPPRVVVESLEQEAKQFWRPDRRGKPVASEIEIRLKHLRESRRAAREIDARIRELAVSTKDSENLLEELKKQRAELKYRQRLASRLHPVQTLRKRIDQLTARAGDISAFADVPADSLQVLREIRSRKGELIERKLGLETRVREDSVTIDSFNEKHRALRAVEDEIRSWSSRIGRHESSVAELEETNSQMREILVRLRPVSESVFGRADLEDVLRQLSGVNQSELLTDIGSIVDSGASRGSSGELESRLVAGKRMALMLGGLGAIGMLAGIALSNALVAGFGLIAAVLAVVFWYNLGRGVLASEELEVDKQQIVSRINQQLGLFRIVEWRLAAGAGDYGLGSDIQRLCDGAYEYTRLLSRQKRLAETVEDDRRRLEVLTARLGTDNHAPPTVLIARMSRDLEDANFRFQSAEKARLRTASVTTELDRTDSTLNRLCEQEGKLADILEKSGEGDVRVGAERISAKRRAFAHAQQLKETLEKDYPDWKRLIESGSSEFQLDEDEVVSIDLQLDAVEERLQSVASDLASAREQMRQLEGSKPASDIEGEIQVAQDDLLSAKIERDRRLLLAAVVRKSEQKFRDQHQPDVVKKANEYLKVITSGRYNKLVLDDLTGALKLWSEEEQNYLDVEQPLSRGTLDQIYLALRVAIVDHLDRNHEKLPIVLDEVLVNWDEKRRQRAYAILKKLSVGRHVLMFTCHQWMVDELSDLLNAQVINLS